MIGHCDAIQGKEIHGWAWHPDRPDEPVRVELVIGDRVVAATDATGFRGDLRNAGIGHGRYAWRLPFAIAADDPSPVRVIVRARGGDPLIGGAFDHHREPPPQDRANPAYRAFVAAVLDPAAAPSPAVATAGATPRVHFLIHSVAGIAMPALGSADYSYGFVVRAYLPVLASLGTVHLLDEDAEATAALHALIQERGESAIPLSFAPPHHTPRGLPAPPVPVIAWEFPTIPNRAWDGDIRNDWRHVLRQTGRIIVASSHSVAAIRAELGAAFPAIAIPTPIFDRMPAAPPAPAPGTRCAIATDGFVFDSRAARPADDDGFAPPPAPDGHTAGGDRHPAGATLDGIVFTAVLAPRDGRKDWKGAITAFIDAHRATGDATLVIKMIATDPADWWSALHETVLNERGFACRIVVIHGYLDEARYAGLIAASHWIVNASLAEGQCLPLLEFMSAGRPAISPDHSAMADYLTASNAILVASSEEYCAWPHDPANRLETLRARLSWASLRDAFVDGYRIATQDRGRYDALAADARATMRGYCGDAVVAERLDSFLGLGQGRARAGASPSRLIAELATA